MVHKFQLFQFYPLIEIDIDLIFISALILLTVDLNPWTFDFHVGPYTFNFFILILFFLIE